MSYTLSDLGWSGFFQRQLNDGTTFTPARLAAVHRDRLAALAPAGDTFLIPDRPTGEFAVGDWVLIDAQNRVQMLLERQTALSRRAAGTGAAEQLIAANTDVLFITSSCNADFSPARLERYLALAHQAGCYPVVVLTKADTCADPADYRRQAEQLEPFLTVLTLDARNPDELRQMLDWVRPGQTAALAGSSGVGKTTLANGMTGRTEATQGIREDDAKGRHTTTARHLHPMVNGGWLIDTPGMRALRLADAAEGIAEVFSDLEDLARGCRFGDCSHDGEPGCAIADAISTGALEAGRLQRWQKLQREDRHNSETLAQSRARDKAFGKMIRSVQKSHKGRKGY
jgi:ribosome biogenesis GTPase